MLILRILYKFSVVLCITLVSREGERERLATNPLEHHADDNNTNTQGRGRAKAGWRIPRTHVRLRCVCGESTEERKMNRYEV